MADIFISYSQKDRERVRLIAEALESQGMDVFWDPEIPPGETWDSVIARELKSARCVIVAWSESSAESDWVKEEAEYGKRMKALVPVQLDPSGPPLGFSRLQTADLSRWAGDPSDSEWQKVLNRVRHHGVDVSTVETVEPTETREAGHLRRALYEEPAQARAPQSPPPYQTQASPPPQAQWQSAQSSSSMTAPKSNSGGFEFGNVFFVPTGRIGQKAFWIGFAIMFGASFLLGMSLAMVPMAAVVVELVLLYPSICLYGKRLHDFGMTAWIYGIFRIAMVIVGATMGVMIGNAGGGMEEVMIITGLIGFVATVAITLWVGLMKSQPTANKHGPPPGQASPADVFA